VTGGAAAACGAGFSLQPAKATATRTANDPRPRREASRDVIV